MKSIAVLMLGLGFGVFGFAAHAQSAQAPSFGGCWPRAPQIRPGQILMACGDGGFVLTGLVWTRWDAAQALGTGVGHTNTCTPLCASGNFHRSRVSLRLWRPETCAGGRREFTRITWRYVADKPTTFPVTGTQKSPFYLRRGCP